MISVIIPCYNHAKAIGPCIESVLAQKGIDCEIIVVNDGSTDETERILEPYGRHATIITQENAGANPARNAGFDASKGEYVMFLDADALMPEGYLAALLKALKDSEDSAFAYSDFYFGFKRFKTGPFNADRLKSMNYIHTSALIRRTVFPGFDPEIKRFQDWDLWLTMVEGGHTGLYVPGIAMRMQRHASGAPMSTWLPKSFYRFPWRLIPSIRKRVETYEAAKRIIQTKHGL